MMEGKYMRGLATVCVRFLPIFGLLCFCGVDWVRAQDESKEEEQYREDYDRAQKIVAISDVNKRADQLLLFIKERPNSKMNEYVQGHYFHLLDGYVKAGGKAELITQAERLIKMRPKVGETYYFLGTGLKNADRFPEAMDALAKCYLIKNPLSAKAKEFLDFIYKARNKGSLDGEDALIKKVQQDFNK
jgi:hypothetical protein